MRISKDCWLINKKIAHRGFWLNGVENSLSAFNKAVINNYPVEIDVFLTADEKIVVFHDNDTFRLTGEKGLIYEKTLSEIKNLYLPNCEKIPTLNEVLTTVNGKIPLLIEIKNQPNGKIVPLLIDELKKYNGEYALQSFNPKFMLAVKKLAPNVLRGILSSAKPDTKSKFERYVVKNMPLNFLVKPDFITYEYKYLPLPKNKTKNKKVIAWTVKSQKDYENIKDKCDNIIFEDFIPID